MNLLFYVSQGNFWTATELQFDPNNLDLWLESPNPLLNSVNRGDWVWVVTHVPNGKYILVSKMCVLQSGCPTTNTYGPYRLAGDQTGTVLYDMNSQPDMQQLVGQLSFGSQPTVPFRETFMELDHLRELDANDQQLLEQWAQTHLRVI